MRVLSPILAFVIWLLAFAAGAALIAGAIYPDLFSDIVPGYLRDHAMQRSFRAIVALAGAVLVLIVVSRLALMTTRQERRARYVSFASPRGTTSVSVDTIEAFLARGCSTLPEVKMLSTDVTPLEDGKTIKVDVTASVYHGQSVSQLGERIRQHIIESAQELLGEEEVGDVNIIIREVEPAEH
jgi:hypothetical protein